VWVCGWVGVSGEASENQKQTTERNDDAQGWNVQNNKFHQNPSPSLMIDLSLVVSLAFGFSFLFSRRL